MIRSVIVGMNKVDDFAVIVTIDDQKRLGAKPKTIDDAHDFRSTPMMEKRFGNT